MVIIIRCNDIASDPRAMKYVRYLQNEHIEHTLIGWDRDGVTPNLPNAIYFKRKAGFNVGGVKAVKNRLAWMWFVFKTLSSIDCKKSLIHGCDLDSAFPAVCYKFFHKSNKVLFDIFDWFSATLYRQKKWILNSFKFMERVTVANSDYYIICEDERREQIPYQLNEKRLSVLPNIPSFDVDDFLKVDSKYGFDNELPVLSYVGGLVNDRCLEEIIDLAEEKKINLLIAGFGKVDLVERLNSLKDCPNIKYFGKVKYTDGLTIMYNSDIIYAMYSVRNPNHVYAAPNKYYEAMFLSKPLFTTKGTIVEKKVLVNGIGYVSGESKEEILSTIRTFDSKSSACMGEKAKELWLNKYENYTRDFLYSKYYKLTQL